MLNQRIAQWENMTREDPDNAMGWFSLGSAYREAERLEDAARCFRRAIELDPNLSRAYQLLGQVLVKAEAEDQAAEVLTKGFTVAAEQGDVMPQRAMESLLKKLGKPVPEVKGPEEATVEVGEGSVLDRRTGQPGPRLPDVPMRGPVGRFIYDHYSAPTWREWIGQGTKVINELRLDFSNVDHQHVYDVQMMEWLGFTREDVDAYTEELRAQGEDIPEPKAKSE
ncbi:MAG: Fe(2+)-trafficking protein [Phycisphaeraceae bacterium]